MRGMINLLGPLFTRAFKPGAGEVLAARLVTVSDSSTRVTVATPTSGKKIRLLSCQLTTSSGSVTTYEVYFHTGANITTNAGKEIASPRLVDTVDPNHVAFWPDGGGPVGAVDDVVSLRTAGDILTGGIIVIHYREE